MKVIGTIEDILKRKGRDVWSISPDATVFEAIQKMADKNVGALIVISGGRLEGVVSERDYSRKVILKGKSSRDIPVRDIMTTKIISVTPTDTVEECMRIMTEKRVRHLPVMVAGDTVGGVVSIGNLVNWIISAQSVAIDQLESYINGSYPG